MDPDVVEHLMELNRVQGQTLEAVNTIKDTLTGERGIVKRVENLESVKNKVYGAGAFVTAISAAWEWLAHHLMKGLGQ